MITCYDDFVGMCLSLQPCQLSMHFWKRAVLGKVSAVDENVARRELWCGVVGVGDADYADWMT